MLPKFNPFDRRTAALPPAIEIVGREVEGWSGKEYLRLRVLNTSAALSLLEKNWKVGATVQHGGKIYLIRSVKVEAPDTGLCDVKVEIAALNLSALLEPTCAEVDLPNTPKLPKISGPKPVRKLIQ